MASHLSLRLQLRHLAASDQHTDERPGLPARRGAPEQQRRAEQAMQKKLDALAEGLADLMEHFVEEHDDDEERTNLRSDARQLKNAVRLEQLEQEE
jgi:protoporphyrinogen oxidase